MAVTKIWPVRDTLKRVVDYAANPEKTTSDDLHQVLEYAGSDGKTHNEKSCLVTGINCSASTAYEEMSAIKKHFGKQGGNVAYHCYQSFNWQIVYGAIAIRFWSQPIWIGSIFTIISS